MFTTPAYPARTYRTKAAALAAERYAADTARLRRLLAAAQHERKLGNWNEVRFAFARMAAIRPALADAHVVASLAVSDTDWRNAFRLASNYVADALATQERDRREAADPLSFVMM